MNGRGQYGSGQQNRWNYPSVGSSLVHVLELKQRYENVRTDAVAVLLRDLSTDGTVSSPDTNRWEAALRDGSWVKFQWYPSSGILDVSISDRQPWPTSQVAAVRRRYQAILGRISPLLQTYQATAVGAALFGPVTYAGQQAQPQPRFAARTRAVKAVFDMYTHLRAPYYLYAEVNGMIDKRPAASLAEANALFAALERSPGEVYVAIFDPTDPLWPGPASDVYHAAPQVPQERAPAVGWYAQAQYGPHAVCFAHRTGTHIGQGSLFGHSPTDVENELDQLHGELMCFGQEVIELLKGPEGQAKTTVQKARDEELAAWKIVDSFQPQVNEVYRIEKLLNDAGISKKTTEYWREQSLPPYADIIAYSAGKAESLKQQFLAAKRALDAVMPRAQRLEAIKRARELTNTRSELEGKALGESPLVQWKRSTWDPFFGSWMKFRSEKKDIPLQTWPLSGTWDRIQEYRQQWIDLRKKAPFKSKCPEPLDPSTRKDPSWTDMFKDLGNIAKYGLIGILALGGIIAVSSVASNLKTGRDPGEKYMEMIRMSRKPRAPRGGRSLPAREQLALPSGEEA